MIESDARTLRVVAPAGSGKTETLVERIAHRARRGVDPSSVLVLTFDTAAARSFAERLAGRFDGRRGPRVSTLNAFGYALLRAWAPTEWRRIAPSGVGEALVEEALLALERTSEAHRATLPSGIARPALELFSRLKNALFDPRAGPAPEAADPILEHALRGALLPPCCDRPRIALLAQALLWLFAAHERLMRRDGWMDFDDQKLRAWSELSRSPVLRARLQRRFREIVVDEFQDINRLDFELVRILAARATLVVAGDDDQAIYGFRGCTSEYILELGARLGRPTVSCELRTNYRNGPNLLRRADRLIRHNRRRIPKRPRAARRHRVEIVVRAAGSAEAEAAALATEILRRTAPGAGLGPEDCAVLYRVNAQSLPIRVALAAAGIPYVVRDPEELRDDGRPAGEGSGARRPPPAPRTGVSLLTYFRAKGLQWHAVFLVGSNAGLVPDLRSPVEDERRLFYVAMTRARSLLAISYVAGPGDGEPGPSRFLAEAGLGR